MRRALIAAGGLAAAAAASLAQTPLEARAVAPQAPTPGAATRRPPTA